MSVFAELANNATEVVAQQGELNANSGKQLQAIGLAVLRSAGRPVHGGTEHRSRPRRR